MRKDDTEGKSSTGRYCFAAEPPNPLILGPMAGITDQPFRLICRQLGAGLVVTEMISANAIRYGSQKTEEMMRIDPAERPVSLQLFGPDPDVMGEAAAHVSKYPYDVLDINMGCPMPKVVHNGEGSALMRDPDLCGRIVEACRKAQDRPVTVKIRSGYSKEEINAAEVAKACEEAGAAAVAVHPRTRDQLYEGKADWSVIRDVVKAVSIPVIGSGDVRSHADAARMREETGCAYVMIARAARGNPWIFSGERPDAGGIFDMILYHARIQAAYAGDALAARQMRKHIGWYVTGLPGAAAMRREANAVCSIREIEGLIARWRTEVPCEGKETPV